jgi:hypothetical protein
VGPVTARARAGESRLELRGRILGCGFTSGDRVVVGMWDDSPIGAFADVMWAEPDGTRVLYADERAATFITAVYEFDRVVHAPVEATWDGRSLEVAFTGGSPGEAAGDGAAGRARTELHFTCGRGVPFPPRPPWVTRRIEAPIARRLFGVETYGVSPTEVQEWYRARRWHRVREARGFVGGRSLGDIAPVAPRCGFGFSEAPELPSLTEVRPLLVDRSGRLGQVVARLAVGVLATVLLGSAAAACGAEGRSDQLELNTVMVDATDWLDEEDSDTVSAIGLELVALGVPLREWFDGTEDHDVLLERMTGAVDRIDARVQGAPREEVRATFEPYVNAWRHILDALATEPYDEAAQARYEQAVARIEELDQRRIDRVVEVYGAAEAERLLAGE